MRRLRQIVALPGLVAAGLVVCVLLAQALWPRLIDGSSLTLPEAVGLGDPADVIRLLRHGADPNARDRLRGRVIGNKGNFRMTPLEAAAAGGSAAMLPLLVQAGARIDSGSYAVAWCFAETLRHSDVSAFLTSQLPGQSPDCRHTRLPW